MGPPYGKLPILFPWRWKFLWEWYGNGMGKRSHYWGSLKIPLACYVVFCVAFGGLDLDLCFEPTETQRNFAGLWAQRNVYIP